MTNRVKLNGSLALIILLLSLIFTYQVFCQKEEENTTLKLEQLKTNLNCLCNEFEKKQRQHYEDRSSKKY